MNDKIKTVSDEIMKIVKDNNLKSNDIEHMFIDIKNEIENQELLAAFTAFSEGFQKECKKQSAGSTNPPVLIVPSAIHDIF